MQTLTKVCTDRLTAVVPSTCPKRPPYPRNMVDLDRENAILDAALSHLGPFAARPRHVQEQVDPEHPGHTFDFAGQRPDGQWVAIEITEATSRVFRQDGDALEYWQETIENALRSGRVAPGTYALSTQSGTSPRMKGLVDRLVSAAATMADDSHTEIARDAWLHHTPRSDGTVRFAWIPGTAGGFNEVSTELVGAAVLDCSAKLRAANAHGYETILLIEPFWLGSVHSWQTAFADLKKAGTLDDFPARVFAVSFTDGVVSLH